MTKNENNVWWKVYLGTQSTRSDERKNNCCLNCLFACMYLNKINNLWHWFMQIILQYEMRVYFIMLCRCDNNADKKRFCSRLMTVSMAAPELIGFDHGRHVSSVGLKGGDLVGFCCCWIQDYIWSHYITYLHYILRSVYIK